MKLSDHLMIYNDMFLTEVQKKGGLLIKTSEWKTLPEVANMPPTIPQRRTKKPQNDLWRLSTRTIMDDMSYLKKIPWKTKHWLLQQS